MRNEGIDFSALIFALRKEEQKIIFTALENKDYEKLDEVIGEEKEKAKLIFTLANDKAKLEELQTIIKNQLNNELKNQELKKTALTEKTSTSSQPFSTNLPNKTKVILIKIKKDILSLLKGEENLSPILAGSFRGDFPKKTDSKKIPQENHLLFFKEFTIFSHQEKTVTLDRNSWFKELSIKKVKEAKKNNDPGKPFSFSAYRQSHYQAQLEAGSYEINIDGKYFYLELTI